MVPQQETLWMVFHRILEAFHVLFVLIFIKTVSNFQDFILQLKLCVDVLVQIPGHNYLVEYVP